ncbi:recombinase zinc beta ribbon domain-containing protein [Streptomyces sp. ISL-94]|uniref:zinc ribbon domain-containing protein n=1 Tax=Streptomyces sp. ISL-94 TaxID=2819190 RepID=UPI0027E4A771|nr:recombinase zinc beta ribbon domain-containing protein [Streptomyces sp. ISL-94]
MDEQERELILAGYRMLMDRQPKTPGDVTRLWNALGSTTPQGGVWTINAVKRVFRAERTGGVVTHKGHDIGDSVYGAPLTREQWENVQTILDGRATPAAQGQGKRKHVYSGFLRCGYCKSIMRVQWVTDQGRTFRRAFCHSGQRTGGGQRLGCGKVSRKYEWIEERLNEVVEAALDRPKPQQPPGPAEDLTGAIRLLEDRIHAMRVMWKAGRMEDEDYFESLAHLRGELQTLRTRETAAAVRHSRAEPDAWTVWRDDSIENLERRRTIVASVIDKVEVFSIGRGRRKPPEMNSIKITPVGAEDQSRSD